MDLLRGGKWGQVEAGTSPLETEGAKRERGWQLGLAPGTTSAEKGGY